MRYSDFRIGNLVLHATTVTKVVAIYENGISVKHSENYPSTILDLQGIQEIPLTDEWLYKFGFELKENTFWNDNVSTLGLEGDRYIHFDGGRIFIRTVHQLQNLFFALTGKELYLPEN